MLTKVRQEMRARILAAAEADPRIVGVLDYGSSSEGRDDAWSDLDLALVLDDEALGPFSADWRDWAVQFGPLLLAYEGGVGHPWAAYDTPGLPLRVDFAFHALSGIGAIAGWPNAPRSLEAMLLLDKTGGQIGALVGRLVGQPLAPPDAAVAFEQVGGDFWYYLLRIYSKLQRGQEWAARHDFTFVIVGNLCALLRLEADATEHWRGMGAAVGIEQVISARRLQQLDETIPGVGRAGLLAAIQRAAQVGYEVCAVVSERQGMPWPKELAQRTLTLYKEEVQEG
jgi:hypothetical protein